MLIQNYENTFMTLPAVFEYVQKDTKMSSTYSGSDIILK
jgi:hypothetical protein